MQQYSPHKDSNAWIAQTWTAFFMSIGMTTTGIIYLPVDLWVKGFMGMGLGFSVASTFSLGKTQRDLYETTKLSSKIEEAQLAQIVAQRVALKQDNGGS